MRAAAGCPVQAHPPVAHPPVTHPPRPCACQVSRHQGGGGAGADAETGEADEEGGEGGEGERWQGELGPSATICGELGRARRRQAEAEAEAEAEAAGGRLVRVGA